jgi:cellobiose transport system permease protein
MAVAHPVRSRSRRRRGAGQHLAASRLTYALLVIVAVLSCFPIYWTIVAASHPNSAMAQTSPPLLPGGELFSNIGKALDEVDMRRAIINSVIVASSISIATCLLCTLAGFAFAKLAFRGRSLLLGVVIFTLMVPSQLGIVPLFMLTSRLGWGNDLKAVIFPTLVSAFGVFFMRQYLVRALPTELLEAAAIDGATVMRTFRSVVLPIARPAMAVLGMLTFITAWNDFFWPIIVLSQSNPTVQVALRGLGLGYVPDQAVIMAGALVGTLPIIVVFVLLGRQIVGGIMQGAVKG